MVDQTSIDLNPVTHITTDAIGEPGKRVFYLQGWKDETVVSLIIEKFQLQHLAVGVEQFLSEINQRVPMLTPASADYDEDKMHILPPVEALFRVSELGLSYEEKEDLVGLIARETPKDSEEEGSEVRFWCSRSQIRALTHWGMEMANRGRPLCEQCGQPMDPDGHFCARKNGHRS